MTEELNIETSRSAKPLFSVAQITLAAFLGAPLAGCLLLAQNYKNLGKGRQAWQSLAMGIILTTIALVIAFWLPENFPGAVFPAIYTVMIYQAAKILQGTEIKNREKQGLKGSWLTTVAIGVGSVILVLAIVFGVVILFFPE